MKITGNTPQEFKKYTGWFRASILAINPNAAELNKIYGEVLDRPEPNYLQDAETMRIDFIIEETNKKFKGKLSFWIKNKFAKKQIIENDIKSEKDVFLNLYGFYAKSANEIQYQAFDGEQKLLSFLKCFTDSKAGFKSSPDIFHIREGEDNNLQPINIEILSEKLRKECKLYLNSNNIWIRAYINETVKDGKSTYYQNFSQNVSYGWSKFEGLDKSEEYFQESMKMSQKLNHLGGKDLVLFISPEEKAKKETTPEDEDELPF
jgi:hypothetical protein